MLAHWLQLHFTPGLGPILVARLIAFSGSVQAACELSIRELQSIEGLGESRARSIANARSRAADMAARELDKCAARGITCLCPEDESYPAQLHNISDPPLVLFMLGNLDSRDLHSLAIVGSRKCSQYGREQAERFAGLFAASGITVISGGARGIDSCAHRGALRHPQGRTIAVLGCGLDIAYPPENADLLVEIAAQGAVLSEFPIGTPPLADNFPRRNRIVSGMSRGVLVVEADVRSGALITARLAADDHNRPVFAIPGRVDNPLSAGPHKLIADGAILTTGMEEIINNLPPLPEQVRHPLSILRPTDLGIEAEDLQDLSPAESPLDNPPPADLFHPHTPAPAHRPDATIAPPGSGQSTPSLQDDTKHADQSVAGLSPQQKQLLAELDDQAIHVDQLITRTGLSAPTVLREMTFLTLKGLARRQDGQCFVLPRRKMT